MANEQNLINLKDRTPEERLEIQRKGGRARAKQRAEEKTFKRILLAMLKDNSIRAGLNNEEAMNLSMIEKAIEGSEKAYEIVRDTIGEKPTDKIEHSGTTTLLKDDINE